jgi:hypothetical protein
VDYFLCFNHHYSSICFSIFSIKSLIRFNFQHSSQTSPEPFLYGPEKRFLISFWNILHRQVEYHGCYWLFCSALQKKIPHFVSLQINGLNRLMYDFGSYVWESKWKVEKTVFQLGFEIFSTITSFIKISSGHSLITKLIFLNFLPDNLRNRWANVLRSVPSWIT